MPEAQASKNENQGDITFQPDNETGKRVVSSIMAGLRGYVQAELNLEKAASAQQAATAQQMRDKKQQDLVNQQKWWEIQIQRANSESQRMQAEKTPETELDKADAKRESANKDIEDLESDGDKLTMKQKAKIKGHDLGDDDNPLKQQEAERALAEERVNTRRGLKPDDPKPEGWLEEVMAEERHIRKQAEPTEPDETESEEMDKEQVDAIARIGRAADLAKALLDGKTVDEFIGEDLSDEEKELYETEMQKSGEGTIIPETTAVKEASKLTAEMNRIEKLAETTGRSVDDILTETGTLAPRDKTIEEQLQENLPIIEGFLNKYPDANFSALQLYQAATGQNVSASAKMELSEYEELVMGIQADIDKNPTRYPKDVDPVAMAYAWIGKSAEYRTLIETQNAGNYTNNIKITPGKYRESEELKGLDNSTVVEITNRNVKSMRDLLAFRIATATQKSYDFVQSQLDELIRAGVNDELTPEQYRIQALAEEMMLRGAEGGTDQRNHVDKFISARNLGRKLMGLEKRMLELGQEGLATGFVGGTLQGLLKHLGHSYDTAFASIKVELTEAYVTYLYEKSGKQTHEKETKRIQEIFPRLNLRLDNNLATIHGWYRTLNTEITDRQNVILGDKFTEMLSSTFHIGGLPTEDAGIDEYINSYENGKSGDPARTMAYKQLGTEEPESDEEIEMMYDIHEEDNMYVIQPRTETEEPEPGETEPGETEPEETRTPEPIDPDDAELSVEKPPGPGTADDSQGAEGTIPGDGQGGSSGAETGEPGAELDGASPDTTQTSALDNVRIGEMEATEWTTGVIANIKTNIEQNGGDPKGWLLAVETSLDRIEGMSPEVKEAILKQIAEELGVAE